MKCLCTALEALTVDALRTAIGFSQHANVYWRPTALHWLWCWSWFSKAFQHHWWTGTTLIYIFQFTNQCEIFGWSRCPAWLSGCGFILCQLVFSLVRSVNQVVIISLGISLRLLMPLSTTVKKSMFSLHWRKKKKSWIVRNSNLSPFYRKLKC